MVLYHSKLIFFIEIQGNNPNKNCLVLSSFGLKKISSGLPSADPGILIHTKISCIHIHTHSFTTTAIHFLINGSLKMEKP